MKGGLNTKLPAVTDAMGRPLKFFMTAGRSVIPPVLPPCWAVCLLPSE